jgi:hypothetical protein
MLEAVKSRQLSTGNVAASREGGAEHETNENAERQDHRQWGSSLRGDSKQRDLPRGYDSFELSERWQAGEAAVVGVIDVRTSLGSESHESQAVGAAIVRDPRPCSGEIGDVADE